MTLEYKEGATLAEKLEADSDFWESVDSKYQFGAYYAGRKITEETAQMLSQNRLKDIRTVTCTYDGEYPLVSYYNDEVTLQCITGEAQEFTYARELQMRSLETALGYSNVLIDVKNVMWPRSSEDRWENYFDKVSSNVGTYWSSFQVFSGTTLSESDERVRSFLNLDYVKERRDNRIELNITGAGENAWFILRTHGEEIAEIEGAEYQKIEEDAFLIQAFSGEVEIELTKSEEQMEFYFPEDNQ